MRYPGRNDLPATSYEQVVTPRVSLSFPGASTQSFLNVTRHHDDHGMSFITE